jgi:hypothetical protein
MDTSWTAGGNLATAKHSTGGAGIQTAALCFGGRVPPIGSTNVTEIYDGTSWTPGSNMNTARRYLSGTGTQTSALGFGGYGPPGSLTATELYDGSSWTTDTNLATGKEQGASANSAPSSAALYLGGRAGASVTANTQEYAAAGAPNTVTITAS